MKLDFPLTAKHLAAWPRYHEKWCERVLSTVLADRERAEDFLLWISESPLSPRSELPNCWSSTERHAN